MYLALLTFEEERKGGKARVTKTDQNLAIAEAQRQPFKPQARQLSECRQSWHAGCVQYDSPFPSKH